MTAMAANLRLISLHQIEKLVATKIEWSRCDY